jgi:septal ring factor EnvC (AmiA/AmiB activator)
VPAVHRQRRERTSQGLRRIADGEANAALSNIDSQNASTHRRIVSQCYNSVPPGTVQRTVFVLILCLSIPLLAGQADRAKTEALARHASERLQGLQREADQLASDERTLLSELRKLEIDRQIKAEQLRQATVDADQVAAQLAATTDQINELQRRDLAERPDVRARLVEIYKLGRARYLRLLLSTSDVGQLGRMARLVASMAQLDRDRVAEHQRTLDSLTAARGELVDRARQMQSLRAEAQRAGEATAVAARARRDRIHELDERRDLNAQFAGELQAAQLKLQATLRDLSNGAAAAEPLSLPLRPFRGALEWPASGPVRRRFGRAGGPGVPESKGIEIAAGEGTPVQAVHGGLVAFADPFSGFGNLVIVDHGSQTFTLYGDLLEIAVKRGGRVERGQLVGSVGSAPAGPPGLYFELRIDGRAVDPLQWLKKR